MQKLYTSLQTKAWWVTAHVFSLPGRSRSAVTHVQFPKVNEGTLFLLPNARGCHNMPEIASSVATGAFYFTPTHTINSQPVSVYLIQILWAVVDRLAAEGAGCAA